MIKFAERLKELRIENGLTQTQLAKNTGVSQAGLAHWEACTRIPNAAVVILLAKYFGVTTDFLLGLTD